MRMFRVSFLYRAHLRARSRSSCPRRAPATARSARLGIWLLRCRVGTLWRMPDHFDSAPDGPGPRKGRFRICDIRFCEVVVSSWKSRGFPRSAHLKDDVRLPYGASMVSGGSATPTSPCMALISHALTRFRYPSSAQAADGEVVWVDADGFYCPALCSLTTSSLAPTTG